MNLRIAPLAVLLALALSGCAKVERRQMEVTAYCGCKKCCSWRRGSWKYLKLDVWNRYTTDGRPYHGRTASGAKPHQPHPGLLSVDSLKHPWMIPVRVAFFPWLLLPSPGTIAADTAYYPFKTEIYVPGYGWGVVEDRGSAIKGPDRLDVYYWRHRRALQFGRQRVTVNIVR